MFTVIDCGSEKSPAIQSVLKRNGAMVQTIGLEQLDGKDPAPKEALVISGAPILLTETDPRPFLAALKFLLTREKPVLGICFGHQVLGMLYGAEINPCEAARTWLDIELLNTHPLLHGLSNPTRMMQDHTEHISLPPHFQLLGHSAISPVEAMAHEGKPLYGLQFHPEVSDDAGAVLLDNFAHIAAEWLVD